VYERLLFIGQKDFWTTTNKNRHHYLQKKWLPIRFVFTPPDHLKLQSDSRNSQQFHLSVNRMKHGMPIRAPLYNQVQQKRKRAGLFEIRQPSNLVYNRQTKKQRHVQNQMPRGVMRYIQSILDRSLQDDQDPLFFN
jgi:hypothetical protein